VASRVSRWGGGLPQYAVGHVDRVARISAAVDEVPGLAICGAAFDGVGIAACVARASMAATRVSRRLGSDGEWRHG
jgi:oxygen-dependent protoporphyrinogen oxidase